MQWPGGASVRRSRFARIFGPGKKTIPVLDSFALYRILVEMAGGKRVVGVGSNIHLEQQGENSRDKYLDP